MTSDIPGKRKPVAFEINDPKVNVSETPQSEIPEFDEEAWKEENNAQISAEHIKPKGIGWFSIFISAIGGLIVMSLIMWAVDFVTTLFFRQDIIGWISLALLAIATLAAVVLILREVLGVSRLKKLGAIRHEAEDALETGELPLARSVVKKLEIILSGRKDLQWSFSKFREHQQDILDSDKLLILAERDIIADLDTQAHNIIASSSRRVAVITALSPAAVLDLVVVLYENIRMLRRLSYLYGGRPGLIGLFHLGKMTLTHLTLTGGLALTGDAIQQLVGQKLAAKLSARFGEGIFNGTMTARIGMAAIDVCRPLPFIDQKRSSIRDFVSALFRSENSR